MLLKAFRNSPRNSRFVRSLKRTFLTMLKSDRKNDGPFSTRLANPHDPTVGCGQLPKPAGPMNLPVGLPCVWLIVTVLGVFAGAEAGGENIDTARLCARTVFSLISFGNT